MLTKSDEEELRMLRESAYRFMSSPLEKVFFELEALVNRPQSSRIDAIMPASAFYVLARAVIELKRSLNLDK